MNRNQFSILETVTDPEVKISASPNYNLVSMRDWDVVISITQHILKKGNLRSVTVTHPIGSKVKFLKFKQTLPGLCKVLSQSSNRKGALKFNFIDGDSMTVIFVGNQPMVLWDPNRLVTGGECFPDVDVVDPAHNTKTTTGVF